MPILKFDQLDPNRFIYYDYNELTRGRMYYRENRAKVLSFDGTTAECSVRDDRVTYKVLIGTKSNQQIQVTCDCPSGEKLRTCKHMVAAIMTLRDYIHTESAHQWQYQLQLALESMPKRKSVVRARNKSAILFGFQFQKYADRTYAGRILPYRIRSQNWDHMEDLESLPNQEEKNKYLEADRSWMRVVEDLNTSIDARLVVNLPADGVQLYNLMLRSTYYYSGNPLDEYLPLLAKMDAPIFMIGPRSTFKQRLQFLTEPVRIEAALARVGTDYTLQAGVDLQGKKFSTIRDTLYFLTTDPVWALAGNYLVPVENPEVMNLVSYFPMTIPEQDEQLFREKYLRTIVEHLPIQGDVISYKDVGGEPLPRLYLRDDEGKLRADLRFAYSGYEVSADPKAETLTVVDVPGSWDLVRVQRKLEQEDLFYQMLTDARYGLKRCTSDFPAGTFELRARTHPFDFLMHAIPLLTQASFEVYGEEKLKENRINRNRPTISLNITSGLDWFDLQAVVKYGDQEVALRDVRRALYKRERYIKLADGSIGQIPVEWMERYKKLFDLSEETEDGLRVRDYHLPLVDTLLEDADERQVAVEFQQRRERLRGFEEIQPQPIPQGFTGELRPYQKAGLDWLHFLHEYGFGGCLADDMGLGKTIQALVFLQSLKEQGKRTAASLLVVPKSLIANWQRETERFTPGLRILEFLGNLRKKDSTLFEDYDIILTTYGTMLRDIEFLRGYRFCYAILDESQNIKNALSQSSKAARLLNASHRLVMTGTPVENNTFELWSQFAFLNPGLLGGLDFFKREFANPIENRAEEETIQVLRKLVYPFILRRTKEQVAPELPERTERVLYCDLAPAQRKVYNATRDYYRGLLLGMIDDEGINDVRMKILEGLLRLRQICIHPVLTQTTYQGEASKFELLLETIETLHAEGHKALIFSQFVQTLHLLKPELDARHICYAYLDGQTQNRQEVVDTFQNDPGVSLFLISLKAGGVGLNLTAADYVIHIDPWWNPAVEMQAADRAHRIGQDKPVFIYKLIARNSVEEKILQLQEHKRELVDQIISAEGSFFKSITRDDVKVLFS